MAVAPLLAGWWLKKGVQLPASPQGGANTDTLTNGNPVTVEFLAEGLWTDLTPYVKADARVDLEGGTSSEGSVANPGSCRFNLKNHEEIGYPFSQGNPASPFYETFQRGTRIRVSVPDGNSKSFRFHGEIDLIEEQCDVSGKNAFVEVTAVGFLNRVGSSAEPLRSAFFREISRYDRTGRALPKGYWPMEDASGSGSCVAAIGNEPMNFTGNPGLNTFSDFKCSEAIPNMNGSKFAAYVPPYTFSSAQKSGVSLWWLMSAADDVTIGTMLVRFVTTQHRWELVYVSAGNVRWRVIDYEDNIIYNSGSIAMDITSTLKWYGVTLLDDPVGSFQFLFSTREVGENSLSTQTAVIAIPQRRILYVQLNPLAVTTDFYIGHVAVFSHIQGGTDADGPYVPSGNMPVDALNAFAGERADERFDRLCEEEGIPHEVVDPLNRDFEVPEGLGEKMGAQLPSELLPLLRQCEATDGGMIYEVRDSFGLGYRTLRTITSQSPAVSLSHGDHELAVQPVPRRDNSRVRNDVSVTRQDGITARVTDTTSKLSVAAVGARPDFETLSLYQDLQASQQASWRVHLGTATQSRYREVSVELAHPTFTADPGLRSQVLGVVEGDRVDITDTPTRISPDDICQLSIGFKETIDNFTHRITWNTIPEEPYRVAIEGEDGFDRMDAEDARLTADATADATSLTVTSFDGTRWIDSATYSDKFPFDINVNGERMTVTTITGTGFTQTFTVTRSVNGVVRPHLSLSEVHIWDIVYLAL